MFCNRLVSAGALVGLLSAGSPIHAQQVSVTSALAPLAGPEYSPASGQESLHFFGTDLGYSVAHRGELRMLFGDTLQDPQLAFLFDDDTQGKLAFAQCPAGDQVDAWVASHPSNSNAVWWKRSGPPLTFVTSTENELGFIQISNHGVPLPLSVGQTPIGAFSDGRDHVFAAFNRSDFAHCVPDATNTGCTPGLVCDTGLGACFGLPVAIPCVLGAGPQGGGCSDGSECTPIGGMCRDPKSSIDDGGIAGRLLAVAQVLQIGVADATHVEQYRTTAWNTNKFLNLAVRSVNDFNPQRAYGKGNDYRAPDGSHLSREKVLLWGRPSFVSSQATDREAQLYFAVADIPQLGSDGTPSWAPRYFTGLNGRGVPQFSSDQSLATPLDLSGGKCDPHEAFDIVDQLTVSWVDSLDKWVMLYGGALPQAIADLYNPGSTPDPDGAIHIRFADYPWGPWSPPQQALRGGDPTQPFTPGSQYAEGGILFHPACTGANCVPGDPPDVQTPVGFLYGPNIIDCWTESRARGDVDLYWNVSTANPYQVVLMKTRVTRGRGH